MYLTDSSVDMPRTILGSSEKEGNTRRSLNQRSRAWQGQPSLVQPVSIHQNQMGPRSATHPPRRQLTQTSGKKKVLPKKDISLGGRVQRLFTSLCAQIDGGHFTNAIKTCDKRMCISIPTDLFDNLAFLSQVLRLVPDDNDAKQTKLFLLLQTERYSDALALLVAANQSSVFERAYSSYRIQHLDEAAGLLDGIKERREQDRGALHLEAQLVRSTSALESTI